MAALPQYQQQTSTPVALQPANLSAARLENPIPQAMAGLGNGLQRAGDLLADYEHNKQVEWAGKTMSDATIKGQQWLEESKQAAPDGAPDFTGQFLKKFDDWSAETLAGTTNGVAREYLARGLQGLRTHLGTQAVTFQAQAGVDSQLNGVEQSYQNFTRLLAGTPSDANYQFYSEQLQGQIETASLPAALKAHLSQQYRIKLAETMGQSLSPAVGLEQLKGAKSGIPEDQRDLPGYNLDLEAAAGNERNVARWVEDLPVDRRPVMVAHLEQAQAKEMAVQRVAVQAQESEQVARYKAGVEVPWETQLTRAQYMAAYPPTEAEARWTAYQSARDMAGLTSSLAMHSVPSITDLLNAKKKEAYDPQNTHSAQSLRDYEQLQMAANDVLTQRTRDPVQFALNHEIYGVAPILSGDVKELAARAAQVQEMSETWGVSPRPFSLAEEAVIAGRLSTSGREADGVVKQMQTLKDFRKAFTNDEMYYSAMQQVAKGKPEIAVAGCILGAPFAVNVGSQTLPQEVVAQRILDGAHRIDGGKGPVQMPEDKEFADKFSEVMGDALDSDPEMARVAFTAAKAYYAGTVPAAEMAGSAAKSISSNVFKEGIQAVTGGVVDINGKKVIPPYGVDALHFENGLRMQYEKAGNPPEAFSKYRFVLGEKPDTYEAVVQGNGTRLMDAKSGQPLVFDFRDSKTYAGSVGKSGLWDLIRGRTGEMTPRESKVGQPAVSK